MNKFLSIVLALSFVIAGQAAEPLKLVPSHPLAKIISRAMASASTTTTLQIEGAPGETVSAQAVLLVGDTADVVKVSISPFQHTDNVGHIPDSIARLQWLRFMSITVNSADIPMDELIGRAPLSIPDPFWEGVERPVETNSFQPLWIELEIPTNAAPGDYQSELYILGKSNRANLPVSLRVRNFSLSAERHQKVMQWWSMPGRTFEHLKPDTEEYWQHLARSCALAQRHRQTEVRVEWDLIQPGKDAGTWDASRCEKYADIAFNAGLRALQFGAFGRHTGSQPQPATRTEAVEENFGRLAALEELVQRRGWKGRIFISLADEPFIHQEETYRALVKRVREAAPNVGIVEAIETERVGDIDIYVPKLPHLNLSWPYYEGLQRAGKEIWFYTCCHPQGRYPNRFLDQPLVKARALHWISYLYDLKGYLHWGFNWYTADGDPYSEKGANPWSLPPGDSQVAYPGTNGWLGSIRLSAMRDGLQDYEYLWTLESRLREMKSRLGDDAAWLDPRQRSVELCRRVVQSFYEHTRDPQVLLQTRAVIANEIEMLDGALPLVVQTTPLDGTITPPGPIQINIRGLSAPGAQITVNGTVLIPGNVRANGVFAHMVYLDKDKPEIVVTTEKDGKTTTAKRTFVIPP